MAASEPRSIAAVAADLGLGESDWRPCDRLVAKIDSAILARPDAVRRGLPNLEKHIENGRIEGIG